MPKTIINMLLLYFKNILILTLKAHSFLTISIMTLKTRPTKIRMQLIE